MELWKIIPSVPTLEASSLGRVRIKAYISAQGKRIAGKPRFGSWVEADQRFIFAHKRARKTYRVARLVCEAFNGPPPFPDALCCHDDENGANNRPGNLVWGTARQNHNYPGRIAKARSRIGAASAVRQGRAKRAGSGAAA